MSDFVLFLFVPPPSPSRGTSSKRHWNDNLNFTQRHLEMDGLPDLDAEDGLEVPEEDHGILARLVSFSPFNSHRDDGACWLLCVVCWMAGTVER